MKGRTCSAVFRCSLQRVHSWDEKRRRREWLSERGWFERREERTRATNSRELFRETRAKSRAAKLVSSQRDSAVLSSCFKLSCVSSLDNNRSPNKRNEHEKTSMREVSLSCFSLLLHRLPVIRVEDSQGFFSACFSVHFFSRNFLDSHKSNTETSEQ